MRPQANAGVFFYITNIVLSYIRHFTIEICVDHQIQNKITFFITVKMLTDLNEQTCGSFYCSFAMLVFV